MRRLLLVLALVAPCLAEAQTTHRYWRYYITATAYPAAPGDIVVVHETEMRETSGGSDLTGSGTPSASSLYAGSSAANAFDNSTATYWASSYAGADDNAWWLQYDFGAGNAYDVSEITITTGSTTTDAAGAPTAFSVQCSDDGTNWTTASTFSGQSWSPSETKTFAIADCLMCVYHSTMGFFGCY